MRNHGMIAMLLATGFATAQPQADATAPAAPAKTPAVEQQAPLEKASDVPDAEKLSRSTGSLADMREVLRQTLEKLEEARRTKDVVKLNCVNEKLTQIKGLLRISEQADVALQEAVSRKDAPASEHEYTKVTIAQQKVKQLRAESEECIGQLAFRTDENLSVEVEEPTNLPGGDPTKTQKPRDVNVRPPPASPTR